ncbi:DUF4377 domain-containing protein [Confluentibacter flavum]|uniref:DUF4377 domain-containing protein n=1 Tax=Confluentibacter flavum TaxID=1909700 RepID=A0A2N3HKU7_9FLAO|nr:DUF4377 domain-containing protein [Confluentibacter flavum]PKQ45543.1 hypothetical protein CSW08_07520 [Confluentibacter flavum]
MMKIKHIFIASFILLNFSCSNDNENSMNSMLWIDSERVSCIDVGEQTCYRIQENDVINENDWLLFYDGIEGFDEQYETGYTYKISVTKIKLKNPPADGSSIQYKLNKILSKELDE